ncbi:MAG: hypothetical protein AAF411_14645 [Myxococcota bacterium]
MRFPMHVFAVPFLLMACGDDAAAPDGAPVNDAFVPALDASLPDAARDGASSVDAANAPDGAEIGPNEGGTMDGGAADGDGGTDGGPPCTDDCPVARLAFSDLTSGPATGLGDGLGSGTIVTVWGYGLGETQGDSTFEFCDSSDRCQPVAHTYYWKNADGALPGGPADLFESHGLQEVAVSIPDAPMGAGELRAVVDGEPSNGLPFAVRRGRLLFVHPDGEDRPSNECRWDSPCANINGDIQSGRRPRALGNQNLDAGDVVYSRGVEERPSSGGGVEAGMFLRALEGTEDAPIAIVAYPGTRPTVRARDRGVNPFRTSGIVISKYEIAVGHLDPSVAAGTSDNPGNPARSDFHITTTRWGRVIANRMIQNDGTCFTGWSGAIVSGGNGGERVRAFGNHIEGLGCPNSSRFQHTVYMSVRGSAEPEAWEFGWNYLDRNDVFYGIHFYDETFDGPCGNVRGTLSVHDNVIVDQRGAGINIATRNREGPCWDGLNIEVQNNLLMNVGLGPISEDNVANGESIRITGDIRAREVIVRHNTVYGYSDADTVAVANTSAIAVNVDGELTIEGNAFFRACEGCEWARVRDGTLRSNAFFGEGEGDPPAWEGNVLTDPLMNREGSRLRVAPESPLSVEGYTPAVPFDLYGRRRTNTLGAVEANPR